MKATLLKLISSIVIGNLVCSSALWADSKTDDIPLVPLVDLIDPQQINLNGTWNYKTSAPSVTGKCPAGLPLSGTLVITQKGKEATLEYVTGATCKPKAVCSYSGGVEGNEFVVSNSVTVDNEGGEVNSAIALKVFSNELAKGKITNHYVHPKGFECRWNMNVTISRKAKKDEK